MTAGYYKNHIDYNRHGTYGVHIDYGKHINYNKPAIACNISTYSSGDPIPFSAPYTPATGPTLYRNDYSAWDGVNPVAPVDIKAVGFGEELCFTMREIVKNSSRVYTIDFTGGAIQISYELINKRFAFRAITVNSNVGVTSNFLSNDTNKEYRVKFWDDINDPDSARTTYVELYDEIDALVYSTNFTIDWTGNGVSNIIQSFMCATSPNIAETDIDLKWHDSRSFGYGEWTTRLKGEFEADRDKIVYDSGYKFQLFDDIEKGMLHPNIGDATVEFLIDDKYQTETACVTVLAGDEPPPLFDGLDFSNSSNSQYLPLITGGGLPNV